MAEKKKFLDFVLLTEEEYKKLVDKFGLNGTVDRIEALNNYLGSKGRRYKSHYFTILVWDEKDRKDKGISDEVTCMVCHQSAGYFDTDQNGKRIGLCVSCWDSFRKADNIYRLGKLPKSQIEKIVEQGKRRPKPKQIDPDLKMKDAAHEQIRNLAKSMKKAKESAK